SRFFGPRRAAAGDLLSLSWRGPYELLLGSEHSCRCYPTPFDPPFFPWEALEFPAAGRRHKTVGTWGFLKLAQTSQEFQPRVPCGRFRLSKCNSVTGRYASQRLLARGSFVLVSISTDHQ